MALYVSVLRENVIERKAVLKIPLEIKKSQQLGGNPKK